MSRLGSSGLLLAVALILGRLGPLDVVPESAGIAAGLLVWAACGLAARLRRGHPRDRAIVIVARGVAVMMLGPFLLSLADAPRTRLAILTGLALVAPAPSSSGALFAGAMLGWTEAETGLPWLRGLEVEFSRIVTAGLGACAGRKLDFGPSASGLDLLVMCLVHMAAGRADGGGWRWPRLLAALIAAASYIVMLPALAAAPQQIPLDGTGLLNLAGEHLAPEPGDLARVMFGWSPALFVALCLICAPGASAGGHPMRARRHVTASRAAAAVRVAGLAIPVTLGGLLVIADRPAGTRRPGDVLLHLSPSFDMNVPVHGSYGLARAGMFGLLPRYLALDGHRLRTHAGAITPVALEDASILVVILPAGPFGDQETRAIRSFVERGGSLLAMGDHTDLMGHMGPLNGLLAGLGIRLRFDSAYPAVRQWSGCLEIPGRSRREVTGIGTGGSLSVWGRARPMVVGRYALSDAGDLRNGGAGGFLGNYSWDEGERLGDLVLAAVAPLGDGRVAVFGDTSSFQNIVLPLSWPFVARLFDDLARPSRPIAGGAAVAAACVALVLAVRSLAGSRLAAAGLAGAVLASASFCALAGPPPPLDRIPAGARVALVDGAHFNGWTREFWREDSIAGLFATLVRDGYLPIVLEESFSRRPAAPGSLPILVAPRTPLTHDETRWLIRHLDQGGDVLVAAGRESGAAAAPLLSVYGLGIGAMPLGPAPVEPDLDEASWRRARRRPQFRQAWPITSHGLARRRVLHRAFGHEVVVEAVAGRAGGRLLIIGDPEFLTDRVLENENAAWEGNVTLLSDLLAGEGSG